MKDGGKERCSEEENEKGWMAEKGARLRDEEKEKNGREG